MLRIRYTSVDLLEFSFCAYRVCKTTGLSKKLSNSSPQMEKSCQKLGSEDWTHTRKWKSIQSCHATPCSSPWNARTHAHKTWDFQMQQFFATSLQIIFFKNCPRNDLAICSLSLRVWCLGRDSRRREASPQHNIQHRNTGWLSTISAGVTGWSYLFHKQSTSPVEHASQGGANLHFHVSF